jgi:hypothetical protein
VTIKKHKTHKKKMKGASERGMIVRDWPVHRIGGQRQTKRDYLEGNAR